MAEEIGFSTNRMTDSDLKAIATYLKSLSDRDDASPAPIAASAARMKVGASIFAAQMLGLPSNRTARASLVFSWARALAAATCSRSDEPHPCSARGRADRFDNR